MKPDLQLQVHAFAGSDIWDTSESLIRVAATLGVCCWCDFNGYELRAYPTSLQEELATDYNIWCAAKKWKRK